MRPAKADSDERPGSVLTDLIVQAAPYMGAASVMSAALLGGGVAGYWLDAKLGTKPLLLTLGLLGGAGIGMYQIARVSIARPKRNGEGR